MNERIFREKSIDRVSSPEQTDDYLRISAPGIWILVLAAALLIAGVAIWGIFGKTEKTVKGVAYSEYGNVLIYVEENVADEIKPGFEVRAGEKTLSMRGKYGYPVMVDESFDEYFLYLGGFEVGDWLYVLSTDGTLPDGIYEADIVTESSDPKIPFFKQK